MQFKTLSTISVRVLVSTNIHPIKHVTLTANIYHTLVSDHIDKTNFYFDSSASNIPDVTHAHIEHK